MGMDTGTRLVKSDSLSMPDNHEINDTLGCSRNQSDPGNYVEWGIRIGSRAVGIPEVNIFL